MLTHSSPWLNTSDGMWPKLAKAQMHVLSFQAAWPTTFYVLGCRCLKVTSTHCATHMRGKPKQLQAAQKAPSELLCANATSNLCSSVLCCSCVHCDNALGTADSGPAGMAIAAGAKLVSGQGCAAADICHQGAAWGLAGWAKQGEHRDPEGCRRGCQQRLCPPPIWRPDDGLPPACHNHLCQH